MDDLLCRPNPGSDLQKRVLVKLTVAQSYI